jgi:hypothetical protein
MEQAMPRRGDFGKTTGAVIPGCEQTLTKNTKGILTTNINPNSICIQMHAISYIKTPLSRWEALMAQMQTISIRIPDEDFQWLLSQGDARERTPSEKLRSLLARVRQQESGLHDPELCSAWLRSLVQPFVDTVAVLERKQRKHSDLVSAAAELVPQIMATLVSSRLTGEQADREAVEIEAILAQQCFRLLTMVLRTAITSTPATYDRCVQDNYLPDIIELAHIISTTKGKEPNHG